jgi:hypothetical protein
LYFHSFSKADIFLSITNNTGEWHLNQTVVFMGASLRLWRAIGGATGEGTGLSASIPRPPKKVPGTFFGGLRYFRFYPLRCSKMASVPFLSCKFFAKQKTYEIRVAGLRAGPASPFGLGSLGQNPKLRKPKRYAFWFGILPPPFGRKPASAAHTATGRLPLLATVTFIVRRACVTPADRTALDGLLYCAPCRPSAADSNGNSAIRGAAIWPGISWAVRIPEIKK